MERSRAIVGAPALLLEYAVQSAVDPMMATDKVDAVGYIVTAAWDAKMEMACNSAQRLSSF
jgi:hypothetical protein